MGKDVFMLIRVHAVALLFGISFLLSSPSMVGADILTIQNGWDYTGDGGTGQVTRTFDGATGELDLTFTLSGSNTKNSTFSIGFDILNPSALKTDLNVQWFGQHITTQGTYHNIAAADVFQLSNGLTTDSSGNGTTSVKLYLYSGPDTPASTYFLEYWYANILPGFTYNGVYYHTGNSEAFADGFDTIVVPDHSAVPEPTTMLLLGFGIIGLAGVRRFK